MALWTASIGVVRGVGGLTLWSEMSRVQCARTNGRARSHRVSWLWLGESVAGWRGLGAL
jgi:hypothetical protein